MFSLMILVVDDDASVVRVMTRQLERAGHVVIGCTDARSALDAANRTGIDLIISDLHLGHETGTELVRDIRRLKPMLRAIIMSGEDLASFDDVDTLEKPFRVSALLRAVELGRADEGEGEFPPRDAGLESDQLDQRWRPRGGRIACARPGV